MRKYILESLQTFLKDRFETEEQFLQVTGPIISFKPGADIQAIHRIVELDVSLPSLFLQFKDI